MAEITVTFPDGQLTNVESFIHPDGVGNDTDAKKLAAVQTFAQEWFDGQLWTMARYEAAAAASDPTV